MSFLCWLFGHKTEERTLWDVFKGHAPPMPLQRMQYHVAVYRKQNETRDQAFARIRQEWEDLSKETVVDECQRCKTLIYKEDNENGS